MSKGCRCCVGPAKKEVDTTNFEQQVKDAQEIWELFREIGINCSTRAETLAWRAKVGFPAEDVEEPLLGHLDQIFLPIHGAGVWEKEADAKDEALEVSPSEEAKVSKTSPSAEARGQASIIKEEDGNVTYEGNEVPAGYVPDFLKTADGSPMVWHKKNRYASWGKKTRERHFKELPEQPKVELNKIKRFLQLRAVVPGRITCLDMLGPMEAMGDNWYRMKWLEFEEAELPTTSELFGGIADWQVAWHGCGLEAIYAIIVEQGLNESQDETLGERFFEGSPGIYAHRDSQKNKVLFYSPLVELCKDGTFWRAMWELRTDRTDKVPAKKTDQWVCRQRSTVLCALWLQGKTHKQLVDQDNVQVKWDPQLEANPWRPDTKRSAELI